MFSYFFIKKYVEGIRNNGLGEKVLLSTRNKCYIMMGKKVFTYFTLIFFLNLDLDQKMHTPYCRLISNGPMSKNDQCLFSRV